MSNLGNRPSVRSVNSSVSPVGRSVRGGGGSFISLQSGYSDRLAQQQQQHHSQPKVVHSPNPYHYHPPQPTSPPYSPTKVPLSTAHFGNLPPSKLTPNRPMQPASSQNPLGPNGSAIAVAKKMQRVGRPRVKTNSIDSSQAPSASPSPASRPINPSHPHKRHPSRSPSGTRTPPPVASPSASSDEFSPSKAGHIKRPLSASFGRAPPSKSFTSSFLGLESSDPLDSTFHAAPYTGAMARPNAAPFESTHYDHAGIGSSGNTRVKSSLEKMHQTSQAQTHAFLATVDPRKFKISYWMTKAANKNDQQQKQMDSSMPALTANGMPLSQAQSGLTTELNAQRVILVGKTIREFDADRSAVPSKYYNIDSLLLGNNYLETTYNLPALFPKLKILSLANNCILHLATLEPLMELPQLTNLYLEGNPLCHMPTYRSHMIEMLPNLQILDGKKITNEERVRAAELLSKEESYLNLMVKNASHILQLNEVIQHLKLNIEFLHFAYGRVGVFNRQHPPLYYSSLNSLDVEGLLVLVHAMDYTDARMRAKMREKCLERVHKKWLSSFRHLLGLDAGSKALSDSWDASFSALLASQQTRTQVLTRQVEDLRKQLHERHQRLMESAEFSERMLEIKPQDHFGTIGGWANSGGVGSPDSKTVLSSSSSKIHQFKEAEKKKSIAARKSEALRDAAASVSGLKRIPARSPSRSPIRDAIEHPSAADVDDSTTTTVVGTTRSSSADRAKRAKALAGLKSKVKSGSAANADAPPPFTTSSRIPVPSSTASSSSSSTKDTAKKPKILGYSAMVEKVQHHAKPWDGIRPRSAVRSNSVQRHTRGGGVDDSEAEEQVSMDQAYGLGDSMGNIHQSYHQHQQARASQLQQQRMELQQQRMDAERRQQTLDESKYEPPHDQEHDHTFFSVHQAQDTPAGVAYSAHGGVPSSSQYYSNTLTTQAHELREEFTNDPRAALSRAASLQSPPSSSFYPPSSPPVLDHSLSSPSSMLHQTQAEELNYRLTPIPASAQKPPLHSSPSRSGTVAAAAGEAESTHIYDTAHPQIYPTAQQLHAHSGQLASPAGMPSPSHLGPPSSPSLNSPEPHHSAHAPRPFLERSLSSPNSRSTSGRPSLTRATSHVEQQRAAGILPDLPALLSQRTEQVENLALLNEKLREKLEEFRVQNLQNVNVADREIVKLNEQVRQLTEANNDLNQRVNTLTEEKGLLLRGHGPSVNEAHAQVVQLQNEKQILARQLNEKETQMRESEEAHAGELLLLRSEETKLRENLANKQRDMNGMEESLRNKELEVLTLQQTLLKVSAEYDRMNGVDHPEGIEDDALRAGMDYNAPSSSYLADAIERAKQLAARQEALRLAEKRRLEEVQAAEAINLAMLQEGKLKTTGNLTQVVNALQESRSLLKLYRKEHERVERNIEDHEMDVYLLNHEAVAVRFLTLSRKIGEKTQKHYMAMWLRYKNSMKNGKQLKLVKQSSLLHHCYEIWKYNHARVVRSRLFHIAHQSRSFFRAWRARTLLEKQRKADELRAEQERQLLALQKEIQRSAIAHWLGTLRQKQAMRRFRQRRNRIRLERFWNRWQWAQYKVQQAEENAVLLQEYLKKNQKMQAFATWRNLFAYSRRIKATIHKFELNETRKYWLNWKSSRNLLRNYLQMQQKAAKIHEIVARKRAILQWKANVFQAIRVRARMKQARTMKPKLLTTKAGRALLAWRALARSHRHQQLALLSLRSATKQRFARHVFHAWFHAMQRVRVHKLHDSNTLLQHDLNLLHTRLKMLNAENQAVTQSLHERVLNEADVAAQNAEIAHKEAIYSNQVKAEQALREQLRTYEQREYELSQAVHDTKHLLSSKISEARALSAQLQQEQELRKRFMRDLDASALSHNSLLENLDLLLAQTASVMLQSQFQNIEGSKQWVVSVTNRLRGMLQSHHAASKTEREAAENALKAAEVFSATVAVDSPTKRAVERADRSLASSPTKAMFHPSYGENHYVPPISAAAIADAQLDLTASGESSSGGSNSPPTLQPPPMMVVDESIAPTLAQTQHPLSPPFEPQFATNTPLAPQPTPASSNVAAARAHYLGNSASSIHFGPASHTALAGYPKPIAATPASVAGTFNPASSSATITATPFHSTVQGSLATTRATPVHPSLAHPAASLLNASAFGSGSYETELDRELREVENMKLRRAQQQQAIPASAFQSTSSTRTSYAGPNKLTTSSSLSSASSIYSTTTTSSSNRLHTTQL